MKWGSLKFALDRMKGKKLKKKTQKTQSFSEFPLLNMDTITCKSNYMKV